MRSEIFNDENRTEWPLFTTVEEVRSKFADGTVIQVAIGGWGDTAGFDAAARTTKSRKLFAKNVKAMLDATGADGVDVDWEYPGYVEYKAFVKVSRSDGICTAATAKTIRPIQIPGRLGKSTRTRNYSQT